MVKADKNKQYSFALITIVAIVAIVGIVIMFLNSQPMLSTGVYTSETAEQESLVGAAATTCADSDGGKNYNLKGTTVKGTTTKIDSCSSQQLTEYYCASNKISSIIYNCGRAGKVCLNGACV